MTQLSSQASPSIAGNSTISATDVLVPRLRVTELEAELWQARRMNITNFVSLIGKIHEVSKQLFPGPVSMEYASDPEDETSEYIVFDVVADGEFKEYVEREFKWHDEVEKIVPGVLSEFRLCVHPKP